MTASTSPKALDRSRRSWLVLLVVVAGLGALVAGGAFLWSRWAGPRARRTAIPAALLKKHPALAAVQLALARDRDLEIVQVDEAAERLTVRHKRTGKQFTASFAELPEGRLRLESSDGEVIFFEFRGGGARAQLVSPKGEMTLSPAVVAEIPAWVPMLPGVQVRPVLRSETPAEKSSTVMFTVEQPIGQLVEFYAQGLEKAGLQVQRLQQTSPDGKQGAMIVGEAPDGSRRAAVVMGTTAKGVQVSVTYSERK